MSYATSVIKSIQQGTITLAAGATTSGTATITSVDTAKTVVLHRGVSAAVNSGAASPELNGRLTLTNATTVTADRSAGGNQSAATFSYVAVEFF